MSELIQKPGKKRGLIGIAGEIFNEAHKNQPEVTEAWIEERAKDLHHELYGEQEEEDYVHGAEFLDIKDFIRLLVVEIWGK